MSSTITKDQLRAGLLTFKGAKFITVVARTNTQARKTGNPYGVIFKTNTVNGQINFHYDLAVIRQLEKEGKTEESFRRGESWHLPYLIDDKLTPLAIKKGEEVPEYLRFRHLGTVGRPIYTDAAGNVLDTEDVTPFLKKESAYENQGTDKPIKFLTYSLASIVSIRIESEDYYVQG